MNKELSKISKLARDFDLKFNRNWFDYAWVSKKEHVLISYVLMCPYSNYSKYGDSLEKRTAKISKFILSSEFKKMSEEIGGQVVTFSFLDKYLPNVINMIPEDKIKKIYLSIYKKIKKFKSKSNKIALLTKIRNKEEKETLTSKILLHEWIHILLEENNLRIGKRIEYNEGLVTYLNFFINEDLNNIEKKMPPKEEGNYYQIFNCAIKFRESFKELDLPKERKTKLTKLVKKYNS